MALKLIERIEDVPFAQRLTPEGKQIAQQRLNDVRLRWAETPPDVFINGLFDRAIGYSRYSDLNRIRIWDRNLKYYKGNHIGHWDSQSPWWIIDDPSSMEGVYRINLYNYFVRSVESLWAKQTTAIQFKARNDNPDTVGSARVATNVNQYWVDKHWSPMLRHLEAKHAQICGNYMRRIFFSAVSEAKATRPKTEEVKISGADEGYLCNECGMAGPTSEKSEGSMQAAGMNTGATMVPLNNGMCPQCGTANIDQFGLPPMTMTVVTGQEEFDPGEPMLEVVDPTEITMHLHSQSKELSPWLVRQRLFASEILEAHFPWAHVPRTTTTDLRLIYQRMAQLDPGSNYSFLADGGLHEMAQLEEGWFEPAMYCHYIPPKTITGTIQLEPGIPMIEQFPNGCYAQRIGNQIVDGPWKAEKDVEWLHGRFDVQPQNIWGRGQDDALSSNERYEELGSLAFEIGMHQASSPIITNQTKIDQDTLSGSPRDIGRMLNPANEDDPNHFIWQGNSQTGGIGTLDAMMSREESTMQKQFSAFASLTGDSEGRGDTATRTAILRDQAVQMHASPLELREQVDVAMAMRVVWLYQRHWTGTRMLFIKGEYDNDEAKLFSRADLQGDFEATAKRGSSLPRGEGERRAAVIEAGQWAGVPGGIFNPVWPAKLRKFVLEELGIQFDVDEAAPDYRKQMMEIRRLEELVGVVIESYEAAGMPAMNPPGLPNMDGTVTNEPTPNEIIAQFLTRKIPVEIARPPAGTMLPNGMIGDGITGPGLSIDNDDIHIQGCMRWLLSDEGMEAHPVLRRAVMIHLQEHVAAQTLTQQWKAMMMMLAQAPLLAAEAGTAGPKGKSEGDSKKGGDSGKHTAEPSQAGRGSGDSAQRRLPGMAAGAMDTTSVAGGL